MTRYAAGTTVPAEKTQAEIRALLTKAGATHFAHGSAPERDVVQVALRGRHYRFTVERPTADAIRAAYIVERIRMGDNKWTAERYAGRRNWQDGLQAEWRRRWRARLLWLKAQIEFSDEVPLEESLLSALVLPDGRTFGDWSTPQIAAMYESGGMPALLGDGR